MDSDWLHLAVLAMPSDGAAVLARVPAWLGKRRDRKAVITCRVEPGVELVVWFSRTVVVIIDGKPKNGCDRWIDISRHEATC